jgi:hypothetical protein
MFVGVPCTLEEDFGYGKENRCCNAQGISDWRRIGGRRIDGFAGIRRNPNTARSHRRSPLVKGVETV